MKDTTGEEEEAATAPVQRTKRIEKVYTIKHIDFVEIAGEGDSVLLIGFRQNQTDLNKSLDNSPINTSKTASTTAEKQQMNTTSFRAAVGNEFLTPSQMNIIGRTST